MEHLETPALLVFLHQITLLGTMLLLNARGVLPMPTASAADLHAATPAATLDSLQLILFFAALMRGSVLFLVALTATVAAVLPPLLGPTLYAQQAMASLASLTPQQQVPPPSPFPAARATAKRGVALDLSLYGLWHTRRYPLHLGHVQVRP
jgi:hypothetical protein